MFSIFHVDLLHEIEIGVWKAVLIHLLRILEAVNENLLHDFDWRYVRLPYFFAIALITVCQFSTSTNIWQRYDPSVHAQHLRAKEDGSMEL